MLTLSGNRIEFRCSRDLQKEVRLSRPENSIEGESIVDLIENSKVNTL